MKLRTKLAEFELKVNDANVTAIQITPTRLKEIRAKHTKVKGRGLDRRATADETAISKQMFLESVKSWDVTDEADELLECNNDNKQKVFEYDQQFVGDFFSVYADAVESREDLEKN